MVKFLFWNTHQNVGINDLVSTFVLEQQIDFVALAEFSADKSELVNKLNVSSDRKYHAIDTLGCKRVTVFSTIESLEPGYYSSYCTTQIMNEKLIIVSVHLPSKLHGSIDNISAVARDIAIEIASHEKKLKTDSTVILGDINTNPYEYTCLGADTFHGMPIFAETKREGRTINGKWYKMFYNPMWRFLARNQNPIGTYYYASDDMTCTYWNLYDQVLIRPCLKNVFVDNSLQIITQIGNTSLVNSNGHPDKNISDHLPIVFEMEV